MAKISVIVPTYNRAGFLKIAVESVLQQIYQDFELIIVDDGSIDGTKEYCETIDDIRIKYIYQFNRGPASARNNGIKNAKGEYIAFLDSDDKWCDNKLQIQINEMMTQSSYLLSHTEEIWYKGKRLIKPKKIHKKRSDDIFKQSLKLCSISMSTVMIKKELIKKIGLFDETLEVCEDYDYWLRVTAYYPVLLIDKPLTIKQGGHYDQQSQKYFGLDKFRIYSLEKIIESGQLDSEKLSLAYKEFEKKCAIYGKGCIKYNRQKEGDYYLGLSQKYRTIKTDR